MQFFLRIADEPQRSFGVNSLQSMEKTDRIRRRRQIKELCAAQRVRDVLISMRWCTRDAIELYYRLKDPEKISRWNDKRVQQQQRRRKADKSAAKNVELCRALLCRSIATNVVVFFFSLVI